MKIKFNHEGHEDAQAFKSGDKDVALRALQNRMFGWLIYIYYVPDTGIMKTYKIVLMPVCVAHRQVEI